jgi:hypothetical protein
MKKWFSAHVSSGPMGLSASEKLCEVANTNKFGPGEIQIVDHTFSGVEYRFEHLDFIYFADRKISVT